MARRISMAGRTELLTAVSTRYGGATRLERSRILDEFAAVTGYHRKHAIRLLSGWGDRRVDELRGGCPDPARSRHCRYGPEIRDALIQLWEVADRVCSKRLRPMITVLLPALERHGRVALDEASRARLLEVSATQAVAGHRMPVGARLPVGQADGRGGSGSSVTHPQLRQGLMRSLSGAHRQMWRELMLFRHQGHLGSGKGSDAGAAEVYDFKGGVSLPD